MVDTVAPSQRQLRTDIQALRGFAVLIVLLYHAKIGLFAAGYLGVDVFFVISGFLITRLIRESIESGNFRFSDFYFRRAKRLLPAAYVTFLVTALVAPFFLASSEMNDLWAQMAGAVTFTANIVLWKQSGYFEGTAELKPLLHVWSLAIEEQFYLLLPAMLVFTPPRFWMRGALGIFLASLILAFTFAGQPASFFLLPTRAWELTIGSMGALLLPGERLRHLLRLAFWPAMGLLLALPAMDFGRSYPGSNALLICLVTLVFILRKHPLLSRGHAMIGLSKVGGISYSLYLVHWPLFAFLNNSWIGETYGEQPTGLRIGLIVLSLLLAFLLNRYVEEPVRHATFKRTTRLLVRTIATSFGLVVVTTGIAHAVTSAKDYAYIRRTNYGFSVACEFGKDFEPIPACRNSDNPAILIWGDSYAMHLVPGILGIVDAPPSIAQATKSVCGPLLGIAMVWEEIYDRKWAEGCIRFNDSVVAYLKGATSVGTVVLSSPFDQFVNESEHLLERDSRDGSYRVVNAGLGNAIEGLRRTIDTVRALGKKVVVVAPPPSSDFDIGRCIERIERKLPILGVDAECKIDVDAYRGVHAKALEFLAALPLQADVDVISFDSFLCDSVKCRTYIDGTFIYRDGRHLSHEGAIFVANRMSLVAKINHAAR